MTDTVRPAWRSVLCVVVAAILLAVAAGAAGGQSSSSFEVEIVNPANDVEDGENLTVDVRVTNTGAAGEQAINLTDGDGTDLDSEVLDLNANEERTVALTWENVPKERSITPTVQSDDDVDSAVVTVLWAEFSVSELDPADATVVDGETVTVNATITNTGTGEGTQEVNLSVGGDVLGTKVIKLGSEESTDISYQGVDPDVDPGTYTHSVASENDTQSGTVVVQQPATYTADIVGTTVANGTVTVDADVTNEGDLTDTQPVAFEVDGAETDETNVTLDGGETTRVTFTHDPAQGSLPIDVSVTTEAPDAATTRITGASVETGPTIEGAAPDTAQADETVTVTYTADGDHVEEVRLTVEDPDGTELFDGPVGAGESAEWDLVLPAREDIVIGEYDVTLEVEDEFGGEASATAEAAFEVESAFDPGEITFGQEAYETPAGDRVTVDVSLNDVGEAYILFGGGLAPDAEAGSPQNFLDILYVSGDATFTINTRLLGTDRPSSQVYVPEDGTVISYAHGPGANAAPEDTEVFEEMRFENENGEVVAGSLAEFRAEMGIGELPRPLQPGAYRLTGGARGTVVVDEDGAADFHNPLGESSVVLTEPELRTVNSYVVPAGTANQVEFRSGEEDDPEPVTIDDVGTIVDSATQRETVADGDRILLEVEATGLYGAMRDAGTSAEKPFPLSEEEEPDGLTPAELDLFLSRQEGINLTVRHTNPRTNKPEMEFDLSSADSDDLYLLPDPGGDGDEPSIERFYVLIDTRRTAPFDTAFEDRLEGLENHSLAFDVAFAYESPSGGEYQFQSGSGEPPAFDPANEPADGTEYYPYFGPEDTTRTVSTSFTVEEPEVEYDDTGEDGVLVVENSSGATVSGRTNIAPGATATVRISNGPVTVTEEDVTIPEDGRFSVGTDLSAFAAGDDVTVEFFVYEKRYDKREAAVVSDREDVASFALQSFAADTTITEGEAGTARVTVANTGLATDTAAVELGANGETVDTREVTLPTGASTTLEFGEALSGLAAGEYTLTAVTPDDRRERTLTVEEPRPVFEVTSLSVASPVERGDGGEVSAMIHNTGTAGATHTVELWVDGEPLEERTVDLDTQNAVRLSFDGVGSDLAPGEHTVTVVTADDEATGLLLVEESAGSSGSNGTDVTDGSETNTGSGTDSTENTGEESADGEGTDGTTGDDGATGTDGTDRDGEEGDSSGEPAGPFGLSIGIGTREAVGATGLVGAAHVLGYWV